VAAYQAKAASYASHFLVVRAWDAFADLADGRLVDLTRTRWGKFRPYLLFASLPLLLSSVALFSVPNFDSTTAKYIYAYITYALLAFLYSLTTIPYGSLAIAMTRTLWSVLVLASGAHWDRSSAPSSSSW
jgi:glucuronide carrier protein